MKIVIYKEEKPEKGDEDYLIKFPKETCVIFIEETIQILFVLDKDISDTKKILNVCRPWNYVRCVVFEGGLGEERNYKKIYGKIIYYQPIENYLNPFSETIKIYPFNFEEPSLKGNKDIELIKNSIPQGILPCTTFRKDNDLIYGSFKKKGRLWFWIRRNLIKLRYINKFNSTGKGYYTYTFKTVSEALPEINKIIGKMGCV